jgi:DNA-binding transcriptional MerR regulator
MHRGHQGSRLSACVPTGAAPVPLSDETEQPLELPAHGKHDGQELLSQRQLVAVDPAVRHQRHRLYDDAAVSRLAFIRHARELGFSLEAIRELLGLAGDPNRPCAAADKIAERHLAAVDERIARLSALRAELARMLTSCQGGRIADCRVIEVLADHGHRHCLSPDHNGDGNGPEGRLGR